MSEVVLVHTSDVHVDDEYNARQFGGDGVGPLRLVLTAAQAARADVVLLVGDTFERHRLPDALIRETARTLAAFSGAVVILPGNHDPVVEDAVFHHPAMRALDNVAILGVTHAEAVLFPAHDLEIWGRPHVSYGNMDPLARPRPRSTRWQVALAHGHFEPTPDRSVRARPSWLVGADEVAATGADYVAFGHWNRPIQVCGADDAGPVPAYYSGSPDYAGTVNVVRLGPAGVVVGRSPLDLPADWRVAP